MARLTAVIAVGLLAMSVHNARALDAIGPSFDCKQAHGIIEQTICENDSLVDLDLELAREFQDALSASNAAPTAIRVHQRQWLKERNKRCLPNPARAPTWTLICLENSYRGRLLALRSGGHDISSSGQDISACRTIATSLPALGTNLIEKPMAETIAATTGSPLSLDARVGGGLSLESTYAGTVNCQTNRVFQTQGGKTISVSIPERFVGGEGALCAGDWVRLAAVNGTPALLEEATHEGITNLDIAVRDKSSWTPACRLSIKTLPHYGIMEQFCDEAACEVLRKIAMKITGERHAGPASEQALVNGEPPLAAKAVWDEILRVATVDKLDEDELPTLGNYERNGFIHSYISSIFVPVVFESNLVLGKIGTAGFGSHFGSAGLFSVYRLVQNHLEPLAGFYLDVTGRTLMSVQVRVAP